MPDPKPGAGPGELPEQFGRYRIFKKLGRGGMGTVYLAQDSQLDRLVALKIPHFSVEHGAEVLERFYREARAAATISHPNICPVHDVGELNGIHYLTMAYIEGKPLSQFVRSDKPLPQQHVAAVVRKLAEALQEAHAHGVIHRDLKPSNIMINQRKDVIIMDFGLARRIHTDVDRLTKTGQILGTPSYMAPEQVRADPNAMGPGCDIYSLGVILYELLTGRLPFEGSSMAVIAQILTDRPTPPSTYRRDLDPRLETICLKAMAKKVEERYATMAQLAVALSDYLQSPGQITGKRSGSQAAEESANAQLWAEVAAQLDKPAALSVGPGTTAGRRSARRWAAAGGVAALVTGLILLLVKVVSLGLLGNDKPDRMARLTTPYVIPKERKPDPADPRLLPMDNVTIKPGEKKSLPVTVDRRGWQGPIKVRVDGLPDKVVANPATIQAEESTVQVELVAAAEAPEGENQARLVALTDGRSVQTTLHISVWKPPPPSLTVLPIAPVTVEAGQSRRINVTVQRRNCQGEVALSVVGLPGKLTAKGAIVAAHEENGKIKLTAAADATETTEEMRLRATISGTQAEQKFMLTVVKLKPLDQAVADGLKWLASHQAPDGHWSLDSFRQHGRCNCTGEGSIANYILGTGFGLLPFLGAGKTHKPSADNSYAKVVEKGLKYLINQQNAQGDFGGDLYAHGVATIAVCEAYGLTSDSLLKPPAQRALNFIARVQSPGGGWGIATGGVEATVSLWQVMALRSGQMVGLDVPNKTLTGASTWLEAVSAGDGVDDVRSATTLVRLLCLQYPNGGSHPAQQATLAKLKQMPAASSPSMYYCYYATQAMHHLGGEPWEFWNANTRIFLIQRQDNGQDRAHPHQKGSWSPIGDPFGPNEGRIMMSSLALLTLEVSYGHLALHGGKIEAGNFAGKWVNVDEKTDGPIRIEISREGKTWTIQAWGAAAGEEIDWGEGPLNLGGDWAADAKLKESGDPEVAEHHLILRLEKDRLIVGALTIFKDNFGRSKYANRYEFKKAK